MSAASFKLTPRPFIALALSVSLASIFCLEAKGDAPTLGITSDDGVPTAELLLTPPPLEGDPRAQVSLSLGGIQGGETSAGSQGVLGEGGVVVTLHCPDAAGHAGVEVPFDAPSLCEVDVGGAWVATHDRVVLITGLPASSEPDVESQTFSWEMLRLGEDFPTVVEFDPSDTMAVRDVGMTDHIIPKVSPIRRI